MKLGAALSLARRDLILLFFILWEIFWPTLLFFSVIFIEVFLRSIYPFLFNVKRGGDISGKFLENFRKHFAHHNPSTKSYFLFDQKLFPLRPKIIFFSIKNKITFDQKWPYYNSSKAFTACSFLKAKVSSIASTNYSGSS